MDLRNLLRSIAIGLASLHAPKPGSLLKSMKDDQKRKKADLRATAEALVKPRVRVKAPSRQRDAV